MVGILKKFMFIYFIFEIEVKQKTQLKIVFYYNLCYRYQIRFCKQMNNSSLVKSKLRLKNEK